MTLNDECKLKSDEATREHKTSWGSKLKTIYTSDDVKDIDQSEPKQAGEYPFTRGIYPEMYRKQLWTKRFLVGHGSVESFNKRQKVLLEAGQTGISFVPCSNSYMRGYDSDMVEKEIVGRTGSPIDSMLDMEIAFKGIPLDSISAAFNDSNPHVLIAMYFVLAQKQGIDISILQGTSNQSDVISHWLSCQQQIRFPLDAHLRGMVDHVIYCIKHIPKWHPLSIVGQHMGEGGLLPAQEAAFALSSGKAFVRKLIEAGLDVDTFAPRLSFFFNIRSKFFEEIAKFRALRKIWARIMRDEFGAKNPKSWLLKFHAQTTGVELAAKEATNNIVRSAFHSLAAVFGGVQSLHTDAYDEALWTPTPDAQRLALMTHNIIAEETGATAVVDPLGGSYFIESLTKDIEEKICEEIETVDKMGGMLEAVNAGYIQERIRASASERQRALDKGEETWVGVNKYQLENEAVKYPPQNEMDFSQIDRQIERTQKLRRTRDQDKAKRALESLRKIAETGEGNLFEGLMEAVKVYVTHGEIIKELRDVFGFGRPDVIY